MPVSVFHQLGLMYLRGLPWVLLVSSQKYDPQLPALFARNVPELVAEAAFLPIGIMFVGYYAMQLLPAVVRPVSLTALFIFDPLVKVLIIVFKPILGIDPANFPWLSRSLFIKDLKFA